MNNGKKEIAVGVVSLVIITSVISFAISAFIFSSKALSMDLLPKQKSVNFDTEKINKIKGYLDKYFLWGTSDLKLTEGAIDGMTDSLKDPYTAYLNEKEYEDLTTETKGTYAGIGIVVSADTKDDSVIVVSPIEDTPGEKAGILPEDKIIKVNGIEVKGSELDKAVAMMKGEEGTKVTLTIKRKDIKEPFQKVITRAKIILKTVKYKTLSNNIGYIRISMFDEKTSEYFNKAYDSLVKSKVKGLIIDVRDNPGGLLEEVVDIADRLVPKGIIVYTLDKNKEKRTWESDAKQAEMPIVLLVNGSSASASEILAGALKDWNKAVLVGTKTFGKGVVQEVIDLKDGTALKVTISEYFTPKGTSIQGKGIIPDKVVELPKNYKSSLQIDEKQDTQLLKAIEILKAKK
ncbi:MAG: S41 family peptidase [Deltaproteobacteria bacterium]